MGVGEMGQIIGETGVGEMGVGEMGVIHQYIVGSLSGRSLTHTEKFRAIWLQWPFTTDFSSSEF